MINQLVSVPAFVATIDQPLLFVCQSVSTCFHREAGQLHLCVRVRVRVCEEQAKRTSIRSSLTTVKITGTTHRRLLSFPDPVCDYVFNVILPTESTLIPNEVAFVRLQTSAISSET